MGALRLEQMYPLTLGANIGTTVTAIMAAMVSSGTEALQVALAHLFFNVSGIIIWYPIPFMRRVPLFCARRLGKATRLWRGFPLVYIAVMFLLIPLIFLGISYMFTEDSKGMTTLASFIVVILALICAWLAYYCQYKGGKEKCVRCLERREYKRVTMLHLPEDMDYLKSKMAALIEHTGLPEDEEGEGDGKQESGTEEDEEPEIEA
jgi:sodium-dependent phosphate cotransporter